MITLLNSFVKNDLIPLLKNFDWDSYTEDLKKKDIIQCDNYSKEKKFEIVSIKNDSQKGDKTISVKFKPSKDELEQKQLVSKRKKYTYKKGRSKVNIIIDKYPIRIKETTAYLDLKICKEDEDPLWILVLERPSFSKSIAKKQNSNVESFNKSGIILKKLDKKNVNKILVEIENYSRKIKVDYHPFSDNKVIDIVHPSLYPFVKGKSKLKKNYNKLEINDKNTDYWNRPYEKSKYQWLPTDFQIDKNGKCTIDGYINNIPNNEINIKKNIESLFTEILPEFERVWNYINTIKLYDDEDIELYFLDNNKTCLTKKLINNSLKNRKLQVITKIITIDLDNSSLDGAWHVEGMSHENIVATAVCILEQTPDFKATLYFKRRFTICEANLIHLNTGQTRPEYLNDYLGYSSNSNKEVIPGLVPLGKINTNSESVIVFPNSHIHKLDVSCKKGGKRKVLVFWLINPDKTIISTSNVEEQQNTKYFTRKEAEDIRLKLMEERKYNKQKFNIRDLNLCEH